MNEDLENIRNNTDEIVDKVDKQALKNFEINLELNNYKSELKHALKRVEEHTYCPGQVPINCLDRKEQQEFDIEALTPEKKIEKVEVHGDDCHCSKCCPNPNPNFFQKHRLGLLIGILWAALIILGIGWTPSGGVFDAIQNSWVELFVNFFKMGIFAIAGIVSYQLLRKKDE